jgi:radical SAM protein with 4Fe4S-binding SPASM domain
MGTGLASSCAPMDLSEQVDLPLPSSAHIEPVGPARAPALLSIETFRALLDQQPGLKSLELQGAGEPLAHPRLFDMIAIAVSRGIDVTTRSNLLAMSDERIEECLASGLRRIDVAPGAAHPSDCDYLDPGSKLRRALKNVRRLAAARRGASPEIRVVLMLLRSNRERLPELIRLVRAHGADAIALEHLWHDQCPARRFVEAESLLKEKPALDEACAFAARLGMRLDMPRARRCERPWRRIHIGAWGEALPCPQARTAQRRTLGNARRDGVVRVWNNDAYREFRERLASDTPPELCRKCSLHESRLTGS